MFMCPYGCDPTGLNPCPGSPFDGGVARGCTASSVTSQQGATNAAVAVTVAGATGAILLAPTAASACAVETDAGVAPDGGAFAVLVVPFSQSSASSFSGVGAQRITWQNGASTIATAIGGTVTLTANQGSAGAAGSYSLTFSDGVESGTFVAPACDACTWM